MKFNIYTFLSEAWNNYADEKLIVHSNVDRSACISFFYADDENTRLRAPNRDSPWLA